jgi:hypothetical protein
MRIAFLDCAAGVAGDMWVGALLDAGLPLAVLERAVRSLGLPGVSIRAERVRRGGLIGTRFVVDLEPPAGARERSLDDVLAIVAAADVPERVRQDCTAVFRALAEAEATVHGVAVADVHFHEVGAEDAIVDVLCACLGMRELGVERTFASAVAVGTGTVRCEHGELPVPAPGALGSLLGVPIRIGGARVERTTPTGAALLRVLVDEFEPRRVIVPEAVGAGAGSRDDPELPNLLRVTLGRSVPGERDEQLVELTCNLDTATGETIAFLIEGCLARGARDAWCVPLVMKKGRPGHALGALVDDTARHAVVAFLLEESSSLGLRLRRVDRIVLERWHETRDTEFGPVRYKLARLPSGAVVERPEDDDVVRIAAERGLARRVVLARLAERR